MTYDLHSVGWSYPLRPRASESFPENLAEKNPYILIIVEGGSSQTPYIYDGKSYLPEPRICAAASASVQT